MACLSAARMPPRSSSGSGCDGPPNNVLPHGVSSDRSCRNYWHFTIHVEAEKLHQPELGRGCLVAQVCSNIMKIVKDAGDQRHGNHGRPRAVLDNRLRLALLHTILEKIQSCCMWVDSSVPPPDGGRAAQESGRAGSPTWHRFDVICRMHRHHLCIYADAIPAVRVEAVGYLNQG